MEEIREANVVLTDDNPIPTNSPAPTSSYSMLEPRMKKVYGAFYKELYFTPERRVLDSKTQELISIAASLVAKCEGCIDGHGLDRRLLALVRPLHLRKGRGRGKAESRDECCRRKSCQ